MSKLIGMGGSATNGSVVYPVKEWSVDAKNDLQDVTDTASSSWTANIAGVNEADIKFSSWWGSGPATLSTAWALGTAIALSLALGNSAQVITGSMLVGGFTITNNCKTPIEFACSGKNNGVIVFP